MSSKKLSKKKNEKTPRYLPSDLQDAWDLCETDLYFPPLPRPKIATSLASGFSEWIETNTWQIKVNLLYKPKELEEEEKIQYLRSILHHESMHYLLIPYDEPLSALLLKRALKHVSPSYGPIVINIVSDIIIEHYLVMRFPELTRWRIRTLIEDQLKRFSGKHSLEWQVLCYTLIHIVNLNSFLQKIPLSKIARQKGKELLHLFQSPQDQNQWPIIVEKTAQIFSQEKMNKKRKKTSTDDYTLGEDFNELCFDATILKTKESIIVNDLYGYHKGDREKFARERTSKALVKDKTGFRTFSTVMQFRGLVDSNQEALIYFYRAHTPDNLKIEILKAHSAGTIPVTPLKWQLSDPIEELDIGTSLAICPQLIPGVTTKRWMKEPRHYIGRKPLLPDLLLVLDSSGSMTTNKKDRLTGTFDLAVLSAFTAIKYARRLNRNLFYAINFSSEVITSKQWTNDLKSIEKTIMIHQRGGTVLPTKKIVKAITDIKKRSLNPVMTLIFTDFGLANWKESLKTLRILSKENPIVLFAIGRKSNKNDSKLAMIEKDGIRIISVNQPKDLVGITLREIARYYK